MTESINVKQPLFMRWYEEYRERRYLLDVADSAVMQHARDLMANALALTSDGKIGLETLSTPPALLVMRLLSHVMEESRLRTGDYRGLFMKYGLRDLTVPKTTAPDPPAAAEVLRVSSESTQLRRLFKFGDRRWLSALLKDGELRISPASAYDDPSLAPAIADDELSVELAAAALEDDIMFLDPFKQRLSDVFGEHVFAPHRLTMRTNYYVWCTSFALRLRMFDDFKADSVLVIRDPGEFTRRLVEQIRDPLHGWRVIPCAVHYFDPYHPTKAAHTVFASKHIRYLYQEEFRYVFLPPDPKDRLEPLTLKLGSLLGIAELYDRR
jgi:hypothetical protein